ncbi:hypothetical protein KFE80_00280 [bacterium SCSIO 12696]|nr:hypothetical protein KFE80_00280 [bacterium SCSIO 12696]
MNRTESINWIRKKCGEGWVPLVEDIYSDLPKGTTITSIYQKWGALMFDASPWSDEVEEIYNRIESVSLQTCEVCGAKGKETTISGWVHTRCENHGI